MVRSIERALDVMELVSKTKEPVPLPVITRTLKMPRTTAFSIVKTLARRGLLEQVPDKGFRVGALAVEWSNALHPPRDLTTVAKPLLARIVAQVNETAFLVVPSEDQIVYVDKVEASQAIRFSAHIGTRRPLYCTAHGKVVLASRSDEWIERYLARTKLKRETAKTITDPDVLLREIAKIRRQGYGVSDGEFSVDAYGLSAPIYDAAHEVAAMLSTTGPTARMKPRKKEIAEFLIQLAAEASRELFGNGREGSEG